MKKGKKTCVITGGSRGIGLAIARKFSSENYNVISIDIQKQKDNLEIEQIIVNINDRGKIKKTISRIIEKYSSIDILVNNAAIVIPRNGFLDVSYDDWEETFSINLLGYICMVKETLPYMIENNFGNIIHIASEAALMPNAELPDYSILKSSVLSLSKLLAREFGNQGIRSNVVSPAFIDTAIFHEKGGLGDKLQKKYGTKTRQSAISQYIKEKKIPLDRLGTVDEVAQLVLFLSKEESNFINGANYIIDGGVTPFI